MIDKNLKYQFYLKSATDAEKSGKISYAISLHKQMITFGIDNQYHKYKITELENLNNLDICCCSKPGFCHRYNVDMNGSLINHDWCKNATTRDRELFLQYKKNDITIIKDEKEDKHWCIFAKQHQKLKDERFQEYLKNKQVYSDISEKLGRVTILSLGHSEQQFRTIKDKKYIKKVNLNKLDAGKYSTNDWSESRAFICKDKLFPDDSEFWGFTTASWNMKYDTNIDEFHNWENTRILLNSKPEDKIIMCADIFCPCVWVNNKSCFHGHNVWSTIYKRNTVQIAKTFLKLIKLENKLHIHTPFSQQLIGHRDNLEKYLLYLKQEDVFAKIDWYVKKLGKSNFTKLFMRTKYNNTRLNGYFMEMTTCFWFANQDYYFLPTTKLQNDWYTEDKGKERLKWK